MARPSKPNALESKPTSPRAMSFPPAGGRRHKVKTGDSWQKLADEAGIPVWSLIYFNFPAVIETQDFQKKCREVNWLMRTHIGCTTSKDGGKNYSFDPSDDPGYVYIPIKPPPPVTPWHPTFDDPRVGPDQPFWEKRGSDWFGAGTKGTADVPTPLDHGNRGKVTDHVVAKMYNLAAPARNSFWLGAHTERVFRMGGDVSAGVVVVFISGIYSPRQLTRIQQKGWDWSLALKGKWSSVAKSSRKLGRLKRLAAKLRKATEPGDLSDLVAAVRFFLEENDLGPGHTKPNYTAIEIPFAGGGLAASVYLGITQFSVWGVKLDN